MAVTGEMSGSLYKPFERLWQFATVAYFAAVLIALYVYSRGDWSWHMPPHLPLALLAPALFSLGLLAIYTGEVSIKGSRFYRSQDPIMYWVCVALTFFFGMVMFLYGIGAIG